MVQSFTVTVTSKSASPLEIRSVSGLGSTAGTWDFEPSIAGACQPGTVLNGAGQTCRIVINIIRDGCSITSELAVTTSLGVLSAQPKAFCDPVSTNKLDDVNVRLRTDQPGKKINGIELSGLQFGDEYGLSCTGCASAKASAQTMITVGSYSDLSSTPSAIIQGQLASDTAEPTVTIWIGSRAITIQPHHGWATVTKRNRGKETTSEFPTVGPAISSNVPPFPGEVPKLGTKPSIRFKTAKGGAMRVVMAGIKGKDVVAGCIGETRCATLNLTDGTPSQRNAEMKKQVGTKTGPMQLTLQPAKTKGATLFASAWKKQGRLCRAYLTDIGSTTGPQWYCTEYKAGS